MLTRLWSHRPLIAAMTRTSYTLRYRQSMLGMAWAVVPLFGTLAVGILIFHRVAGVGLEGVPYPLATMSALVPWALFSSSMQFGVPSIASAQPLITRMSFPRAAIPLSVIGTAIVDLGVGIVALVGVLALYRWPISIALAWFPALLMLELAFTAGLVLLGSALNTFARDFRLLVPVVVQLWLFLTPVMYPLDQVPAGLRAFFLANPMTGLVESFRRIVVFGQPPEFALLVPSIVGAVIVCIVGVWYFAQTERRFADVA